MLISLLEHELHEQAAGPCLAVPALTKFALAPQAKEGIRCASPARSDLRSYGASGAVGVPRGARPLWGSPWAEGGGGGPVGDTVRTSRKGARWGRPKSGGRSREGDVGTPRADGVTRPRPGGAFPRRDFQGRSAARRGISGLDQRDRSAEREPRGRAVEQPGRAPSLGSGGSGPALRGLGVRGRGGAGPGARSLPLDSAPQGAARLGMAGRPARLLVLLLSWLRLLEGAKILTLSLFGECSEAPRSSLLGCWTERDPPLWEPSGRGCQTAAPRESGRASLKPRTGQEERAACPSRRPGPSGRRSFLIPSRKSGPQVS